jgi:two-component system, NtrC family, sensor histidine kinase GlrK
MVKPRLSFLFWTTLALVIVLIPPNVALWSSALEVDRLARDGAGAVLEAAERAQLSRGLLEQLTAVERIVRQLHGLAEFGDEDPALVERYEARRSKFVEALEQLGKPGGEPQLMAMLARLRAAEERVYRELSSAPPASEAFEHGMAQFDALTETTREVVEETERATRLVSEDLSQRSTALQTRLLRTFFLGLILLPLMVGLALLTVVWPIRQLDEAIRVLGAGDVDHPVHIRGPVDVRGLGERLEWLRQQMVKVERDREQVLHHVSHQLKTPLTCVREGAQLLRDGVGGRLNAEQDGIAEIISTNARELGRRIDELQKGLVRLDVRRIAFDEIVRRVLRQNDVSAVARSVKLRPELERVVVWADPSKLEIAVDNLVSNAIKYSPEGGIVRVALRHQADGALLTVEDQGPGIPLEERERVFDAFYQGKATWLRHVGGTGLGLAIAREYVRAHGGEVWVGDGQPGAQMLITLPKEAA